MEFMGRVFRCGLFYLSKKKNKKSFHTPLHRNGAYAIISAVKPNKAKRTTHTTQKKERNENGNQEDGQGQWQGQGPHD